MKEDLTKVFNNFLARINWYTDLLIKICEPLSTAEKSEVYESFVLKICVTWETFIEDLLALCLSKDASQYSEYMDTKFPKHPSKELGETLISGYRYFDFKNVGELKGISKNILVLAYNPFIRVPQRESKKIDEFFLIRNYIAHRSRVAKRSLSRLYREVYHLREFQEPGAFLLSPLHEKSDEVRFGEYILAFINAADVMAKHLGV